MNSDTHYTPTAIADTLVTYGRLPPSGGIVGDLTAGEGRLLAAARRRWPDAPIVATDVNPNAVARLRRSYPDWSSGQVNLLQERSRLRCRALSKLNKKISLLLMNPPFTSRGGSRNRVDFGDCRLACGGALSFVLTAIQYLAPDGQVVAILPVGSLHNQKDADAWRYLLARFAVEILEHVGKRSFPGCAASSAIVRLSQKRATDKKSAGYEVQQLSSSPALKGIEIIRGTCPVHSMPNERQGPTLVHSTDLRNTTVILNGHGGYGQHRCVEGPAVLLPRVGRLTPEKIGILPSAERVMISDCVIALRTERMPTAKRLQETLHNNFDRLAAGYVGTGAPHVTLRRLQAILADIGASDLSVETR